MYANNELDKKGKFSNISFKFYFKMTFSIDFKHFTGRSETTNGEVRKAQK